MGGGEGEGERGGENGAQRERERERGGGERRLGGESKEEEIIIMG